MKESKPKNSRKPTRRDQSRSKEAVPATDSAVRPIILVLAAVAIVVPSVLFLVSWLSRRDQTEQHLADAGVAALEIQYPSDGAMFPPDMASPTFQWQDPAPVATRWSIRVEFEDGRPGLQFASTQQQWTPPDQDWETIKRRSVSEPARVTIEGTGWEPTAKRISSGQVSICTSEDEVGAPIFYREVNLPFAEAVRNPGAHIRWRFGTVSSGEQPPIVLERLLVCGNCHSFSADGSVLGMDVDYASDKGSYAICPVAEEMSLSNDKIITWSDYQREDDKKTFGLLSQVSPDGRYVVSTVKDLSVFQAVDDLTFSQLFFPIRGILCVYDRETGTYKSLPGGDDESYVQSNATWSPDGKYIVFARCEAYQAPEARANELGLTRAEEISKFLSERETFRFNLYRVPFNDGQGGHAEPLAGASHNDRSNYFARYSPDGRWIVFCQANSFMLLQPDSELFIIPAEGGQARRLECNTHRMNSWHSWSPNSRWLVFSSKAFTPYTQLFLAHIDEQGHASPPVVLSRFTVPDMAANIPEFVDTSPDAIKVIRNDFIEDLYHVEAADKHALAGRYDAAVEEIQKAIAINPDRARTHRLWGVMLMSQRKLDKAEERIRKAIELRPDDRRAHWNLAKVCALLGKRDEAEQTYKKAIELDPFHVPARLDFARFLLEMGRGDEAVAQLTEAAQVEPKNPLPYCVLGDVYVEQKDAVKAAEAFALALERDSNAIHALVRLAWIMIAEPSSQSYDEQQAMRLATKACELTDYRDPHVLIILSDVYSARGDRENAISSAEAALRMARASGDTELASEIRAKLERFKAP